MIEQVKDSELLQQWLNPKYLKQDNLYKLRKTLHSASPFPHLEMKDFFLESKAKLLLEALADEEFEHKESDLFKFTQTAELASSTNPLIKSFRKLLLSNDFLFLMAFLSKKDLIEHVDIFGSVYQDTDFLLPHDDLLETRRIAYSYYLSSRDKADGGCLHLFSTQNNLPTRVKQKIVPKFNTFVLFLVSEKSFHEVEEVYNDTQRIAITGWFHGD